MRTPLVRWLYNLFFPFVFALMLPSYLRRMARRGNYRRNVGQRFGFYAKNVRTRLADGPPRVWVQAVSVGEMLTALKLVGALRERCPDLPLILSTTTTTGYQLALDRASPGVEVVYTPLDLSWSVKRAFDALRPSQVVIVDGGLWPNLLWEARRRGVPNALVNARLSPRSEKRFRRFRFLAAPMFRSLDLVCVSENDDVRRWRQLGIPAERLHRTGSIKFDTVSAGDSPSAAPDHFRALLRDLGLPDDAPVLLAGSTHPGEERLLAGVYQRLRDKFPGLRLLVAPRHVERTNHIRAELEAMGLAVIRRTDTAAPRAGPTINAPAFDVLLLDTTGELRDWYALATVVFIGKSFTAVGGQNPAEAIAAHRPVIFGPHMENFRDLAAQLVRAEGAWQAADVVDLEAACRRLLADVSKRNRLADNALEVLTIHRGAALRTADLLLAGAKLSACQAG